MQSPPKKTPWWLRSHRSLPKLEAHSTQRSASYGNTKCFHNNSNNMSAVTCNSSLITTVRLLWTLSSGHGLVWFQHQNFLASLSNRWNLKTALFRLVINKSNASYVSYVTHRLLQVQSYLSCVTWFQNDSCSQAGCKTWSPEGKSSVWPIQPPDHTPTDFCRSLYNCTR